MHYQPHHSGVIGRLYWIEYAALGFAEFLSVLLG